MDAKRLVRDGYDRVSHAYRDDLGNGAFPEHDYRPWVDGLTARLVAGAPVLELGCGCGLPVAAMLSQRHPYTGIDISPAQIERARRLVPAGRFTCADMAAVTYPPASFAAIAALYSIIHVPLNEQPSLFHRITEWLEPGGWLLATVGHRAGGGTEEDWLGVPGATMYWSHADAETYLRWCEEAGLYVEASRLIPEDQSGHQLLLARKIVEVRS